MSGQFTEQIKQFERSVEKRYRAIAREAVQETVSMAQKPTGNGGRMRIDTGFLRASIQAAIGTMPSGPTTNDGGHGGKNKYKDDMQVAGEPVAATLLRWNPMRGEILFIGWTANYARPREYKDGFMRGATEKWDQTLKKVAKSVEARY